MHSLEKTLRLIAGIVVSASVVLGMTVHPNWFYLTLFAGLNLLQSGLTNWCPMMAILRKAGLR
ncbi:YgaP family membrane protein [Luteitalea sp.]